MEEFEIREVTLQDAAMLARFGNESRAAWPGQFGGVDDTEESVRAELRDWGYLKYFVAASQKRIIGVGVLQEDMREKDACYVAYLSVHQDFHGKKFGKRLLLSCVNAGCGMGYSRIDLHTWPANLKSVPLYKKAGFFWVPDSRVYMQNFLPAIFADPIAKRYFAKHDWYETFRHELKQEEDKTEVRGRKIFVYLWAAGGDTLKAIIDRESGGICEITDGDLTLATSAEQEPIIGMPHKIRWHLRKRSKGPAPVTLIARGEDGVRLSLHKSFSLDEKKDLDASFDIDPEIKRKDDGTAHKLNSQIVMAGEVSELGTGLRPRHAVTIFTEPPDISLVPGQVADARICMRSFVKKQARGTLHITPAEGLSLECPERTFTIPAEGTAGIPVRLTPKRPGVFVLKTRAALTLDGKRLTSKMENIHISASNPGQLVCFEREDGAVLENDRLRVSVNAFGASFSFTDKATGRFFGRLRAPALGPPFQPSEFGPKKFDIRLERAENEATLELSTKSEKFPGLTLTRKLTMGAGPLITVEHHIENRGNKPHKMTAQVTTWAQRQHAKLTVPTAKGLVSDHVTATDYPQRDEYPKKPDEMEETWLAYESKGMVFGLIWEECEQLNIAGPSLHIPLPKVAPGTEVHHAPVYIYAGPGDWRAVRSLWQRYIQKPAAKPPKPPQARQVCKVEFEPNPIAFQGRNAKARISLTALTKLAHTGKLELTAPDGWRVSPRRLKFEAVSANGPFQGEVSISATRKPKPSVASLLVRCSEAAEDREMSFPIICLGPGGKKPSVSRNHVEGHEVFAIENGLLTLRVASDFMGSVYALEEGGTNHLFSAFPKPGEWLWEKPWYGGFHPSFHGRWFPTGMLDKEKFRCEPVTRVGSQGWSGVRLSANISRRGCKRVGVRFEYLTLPESNVVAIRTQIHNRGTADFRSGGIARCALQVGGDRSKAVVHYECGRARTRRRTNVPLWLGERDWAAVGDPERNRYLVMVNASEDSSVGINDIHKDGAHLAFNADLHVLPREKRTFLCYLVLTDSADKACLYSSLRQMKTL